MSLNATGVVAYAALILALDLTPEEEAEFTRRMAATPVAETGSECVEQVRAIVAEIREGQ